MNKILMSILLVLMLAFSMLGNVSIAKAAIVGVIPSVPTYEPGTVILETGVTQSLVSFTIPNNRGDNAPISLEVTPRIPTNGQYNLDIISFEGRIGEQIIQPNVNGILTTEIQPNSILSVSFIITDGVGINPNTPAGTYGNVVDIFELDPENNNQRIVGSSTQVNYQISIEESNPSILISGLDGNNELVFTGEEDSAPTQTITITNNGNRDFDNDELKLVFPNPFEDSNIFTFVSFAESKVSTILGLELRSQNAVFISNL